LDSESLAQVSTFQDAPSLPMVDLNVNVFSNSPAALVRCPVVTTEW
jgi:hypothetical protein